MPPYEETGFAAVKQAADSQGLFCSMEDKNHFAVEFPSAPGAKSRLFAAEEIREEVLQSGNYSPEEIDEMAGETSLLQMLVMDHPLYGKGLQCRLEIPVTSPGTPDVKFVNALNAWELSGSDLPPLFGAWCIGPRAPTFVTFLPTQYCVPGLLHNLMIWALVRGNRLKQWFSNSEMVH